MTFTELKTEVAALGFDDTPADEGRLAAFARHAQGEIFSDRGVVRTVRIYIPKARYLSRLEGIRHKAGECERIPLKGGAYCIELAGKGMIEICEAGTVRREEFDTDGVTFKGIISSGEATLTLHGDTSFTVTGLAVFADSFSSDPDRIPEADGRIINRQAARSGDFLCFTGLPKDLTGAAASCISMVDGEVTFPPGTAGEFYLTYRRAPRPIQYGTPLEPIDVPLECERLLSLLTASYACLDYDPEQAKLYRDIYEREMRELNASSSFLISADYHDVVGWA